MVQQVLERYGRLDGVVNCVGSVVARSALATDLQELRETLDVSVAVGFWLRPCRETACCNRLAGSLMAAPAIKSPHTG